MTSRMPAVKVERTQLLELLALLDRARDLRNVGDTSAQRLEHQARALVALVIDSAPLVWSGGANG